jgi:hypothetical protein
MVVLGDVSDVFGRTGTLRACLGQLARAAAARAARHEPAPVGVCGHLPGGLPRPEPTGGGSPWRTRSSPSPGGTARRGLTPRSRCARNHHLAAPTPSQGTKECSFSTRAALRETESRDPRDARSSSEAQVNKTSARGSRRRGSSSEVAAFERAAEDRLGLPSVFHCETDPAADPGARTSKPYSRCAGASFPVAAVEPATRALVAVAARDCLSRLPARDSTHDLHAQGSPRSRMRLLLASPGALASGSRRRARSAMLASGWARIP